MDRWKIGRAVNLAIANMPAADREKWYQDMLPGWSKSTIDRMRRIAKMFASPDDINEVALTGKKKPNEKSKLKREAFTKAMTQLDDLIRRHPNSKQLVELQELVREFAPSMQMREKAASE